LSANHQGFVILTGEVKPRTDPVDQGSVMKEFGKSAVPPIRHRALTPQNPVGKIMRRFKAKELGQDLGDISTIED